MPNRESRVNALEIDGSSTGDGGVHRWEMPSWWVPFMVGILVVMLVFGLLFSARIFEDGGWVGGVFMAAWFAALAWNLYWWLFRVAYRLELRGEMLYWRAPFARGSFSVQAITGVTPFFGTTNRMPTIRSVGSRMVPVFAYGDLSSFLARLNVINTTVPDRVRGFAGHYDKVTGNIAMRRQRRHTDA